MVESEPIEDALSYNESVVVALERVETERGIAQEGIVVEWGVLVFRLFLVFTSARPIVSPSDVEEQGLSIPDREEKTEVTAVGVDADLELPDRLVSDSARMQILAGADAEVAGVVEKNVVCVINVAQEFFSFLDIAVDPAVLPLRHEILESLLDVAVKPDFCDKAGDVAALVEHEVMPCVGGFIERESVLSTTGRINAVGAV